MIQGTYLVFEVAGRACALRRDRVRRILPLPMLGRPPGLPAAVEGVLDLAGTAIPVLRLALLFGLAPMPLHAYQHLILLAGAPPTFALLVERATGVVTVADGDVAPLPEGETFNGCVVGHIASDRGPIHVLSAERLLTRRELDMLSEFQATEQRRLKAMAGAA